MYQKIIYHPHCSTNHHPEMQKNSNRQIQRQVDFNRQLWLVSTHISPIIHIRDMRQDQPAKLLHMRLPIFFRTCSQSIEKMIGKIDGDRTGPLSKICRLIFERPSHENINGRAEVPFGTLRKKITDIIGDVLKLRKMAVIDLQGDSPAVKRNFIISSKYGKDTTEICHCKANASDSCDATDRWTT